MDITKIIAEMKQDGKFAERVGMILIHQGVVRGWSRLNRKPVTAIEVKVNESKVEELRKEYSQKPGIYKILIECRSGRLKPGDDLLFIVVAGDLRENVKPVLSELLDRIKSEAVTKSEITSIT